MEVRVTAVLAFHIVSIFLPVLQGLIMRCLQRSVVNWRKKEEA